MIDIKEQFKEKYAEDIIQLKNLVENYNNLQEQNIASAYEIMKKSLIIFNRWIYIQAEFTNGLSRGECSQIKKLIENYIRLIDNIHTDARIIYKNGRDDARAKTYIQYLQDK